MISMNGLNVFVVPLEGLKMFKCYIPLKFLTIIEIPLLH
jgi:hypothetical protein